MKIGVSGSSPTVPDEDDELAHEAWRERRRHVRRMVARIPELSQEARSIPLDPWEPPIVVRALPRRISARIEWRPCDT